MKLLPPSPKSGTCSSWLVVMRTCFVVFVCVIAVVEASCATGTSLGVARDKQQGSSNHPRRFSEVQPADSDDSEMNSSDYNALPDNSTSTLIDHGSSSFSLWTLLWSSLVALASATFIPWLVQKKAFIEASEKVPGLSLKNDDDNDCHSWLGHMYLFMDLKGENPIPGYPGLSRSFDEVMKLRKQFENDGLFRCWIFHPYKVPFASSVVMVNDIDLVRQLLTDKSITRHLIKQPDIYQLCHALVGNSFLALPDDTPRWKHQRKLTAMGIRQSFLEHTCDITTDLLYGKVFPALDRNLNDDKSATTREVGEWCTRLTAEILGQVAFGYSFGGLEEEMTTTTTDSSTMFDVYQNLNTIISRRSLRGPPIVNWFYREENKRFKRCEQKINSTIQTIVNNRLEELQKRKASKNDNYCSDDKENGYIKKKKTTKEFQDLLFYMMQDDEDNDEKYRLTEEELIGNIRMFLFAGQDTTAIVLSQTLYDLATHPAAQERLQNEVDDLFAKLQDDGAHPSYGDLMKLDYLDAVVKEGLRLHAPAGVARRNLEDITLRKNNGRNYLIPKGTNIFVYPHLTCQGGPDHDRMDEFWPERFLLQENDRVKSCWIPFSIGPRNCVGQPLAIAELKGILAHILHRYKIQKTQGYEDPIKMTLITIKSHKIMLDFIRR